MGRIDQFNDNRYSIKHIAVKIYNSQQYLSCTDATQIIEEIADIGEVCGNVYGLNKVFKTEIIGILSYNGFHGCISCCTKVTVFSSAIVVSVG